MIIQAIKKYIAIAGLVAFLGVGAYAGYLKLQNVTQASTIRQKEQALSVALGANKSMEATIKTLGEDKKKLDQILLQREEYNEKLGKENAKLLATIKAVKEDQYWNSAVLVPCDVVNSLFPNKGLGCRTQTQ